MRKIRFGLAVVALVFFGLGCAGFRPPNAALEQWSPDYGYRASNLRKNHPTGRVALLMAFSGGGTRAAALSYGVLQELRDTLVPGTDQRLLDEIDVITSVSGGSFTSAYFGLFGDRIFQDYEERFLRRDVTSRLWLSLFNPLNWFRMLTSLSRTELAIEFYDRDVFDSSTFQDLLERPGPFLRINATDVSITEQFTFEQPFFDLICSDLGTLHLSRAAATSSAVPVVLSPVTMDNYGGSCGYEYPAWVSDARKNRHDSGHSERALARYREMRTFQDSDKHPYLHLVDGGVADNLGVRGVLEALDEVSFSGGFRRQVDYGGIRRIVLIVVNAESDGPNDWDQKESPPGSIKQTLQSSGVPISRYTFETVELMKDMVDKAALQRDLDIAEARVAGASKKEAEARFPEVEMLVFDVSFNAIEDDDERLYFQNLPTSFTLEDEQVDRLRDIASDLLRHSPTYQDVLDEIGAKLVQ